MVDELNLFQPESLFTYPSIASLLAIEQLEGRLHIHPQVVETGAEVRTEQMEQNIRRAWSVAPFNVYGTTEGGPCNVDCSYHRGIHVFEDLVLMEVVDERNQAVPDGLPGSKVLITNLFNFTQPLIRYEVTDMLTISPEPCPCG
jgi:phenylacetate-coenzyme A ligase PaaK-like adenylate-forming protein